jgi:hypothetical protein
MHSSVAGRACAKAAALLLPAGRAFARANLRAARVAEDSEGSSLVGQKHCTGIHLGELPRIGGCGARLIMACLVGPMAVCQHCSSASACVKQRGMFLVCLHCLLLVLPFIVFEARISSSTLGLARN